MNSQAAYPSLGRARFAQCALALVALFGAMDTQVVGLLIQPIKLELHLTDVQIGLAYGTAYFAAYGLLAIPAGMLADRLPRVRLVILAMLLNCGGLALAGLSHSLGVLVLAKIVSGLHAAIIYPAAMSLLADFFEPGRRAFGTMSYPIGQALGNVAALLIGGLGYSALVDAVTADPHLMGGLSPWRAVSLIFAAIGILILPLLLGLREPARMEAGKGTQGSFRELWTYRRVLVPLFLGLMGLSGALAGVMTWFAPALMRLYGLQPGDFAAASSAIILGCSVASMLAAGKLVNFARARTGSHALMWPAAILAVLCMPCSFMGMMPTATGFAVLCACYLLFNNTALALPILAINFQIPNELRGLCMGAYVVLLSLAAVVCSPLVGYVERRLGGDQMIGQAIGIVAVPCLLVASLSFWFASRRNAGASFDPALAGSLN